MGKANELLSYAWGIIANVNGGDWDFQSDTWRAAAKKWRKEYYELLSQTEESDDTGEQQ